MGRSMTLPDLVVGSLAIVGALLEQINDYYVQLMYDFAQDRAYVRRHRRLRRGSIGRALAAADQANQRPWHKGGA
jgi:hypothetical protein